MQLVSLRPRYLISLRPVAGHGCVRQTVVDHPLRSDNYLAPGETHFVLTIVSVNVVQHTRHWHAIKIVHVKIAVAVPSLGLRQGKALTTVVVLD